MLPQQVQQVPGGQPHGGGVVVGVNADAASLEIPVQIELHRPVRIVQQAQRRHGPGGQVQPGHQVLRGGEAQPGGAVAALKLLQVHPLVVADGDEIVILLFGVPDEDVLGVVLRIWHIHGGALLHIEHRRVLGDLKGHAPGPEVVIGFLLGHGMLLLGCSGDFALL